MMACGCRSAAASGEAAGRAAQGILAELEDKLRVVESYEASYVIAEGQKVIFTGRFKSKGVHRFRWEDLDPSTGTLAALNVSDGQREWMYMPAENLVFRSERSRKTSSIETLSPVVARFASGEDLTYQGDADYGGRRCHIVVVKALHGPDDAQIPATELWFDAETGLVARVVYAESKADPSREIAFKDFKINVPIEDSEFTFTPPPNAQLVDWIPGQGEGVVPLNIRVPGKKNGDWAK